MMRRLLTTIVLACCVINAVGQASGDRIDLADFHQIDAKGNIELTIHISDSISALTVQHKNITEKNFHFKVRKGVLSLDVPSGLLTSQGFAKVDVYTPRLERIKSEGATIKCLTTIGGEYFEYTTQGSINVAILNVGVDKLVIRTIGKSDVMVVGRATQVELNAKLGSRIDAFRLTTEVCTANSYDGSEIYVCPTKSLKAKASLAGSIYYMGNATIEPKVSLWGDVILIQRDKYQPIFIYTPNTTTTTPQKEEEVIVVSKPDVVSDKKTTPKPTEHKSEKKSIKRQEPKEEPISTGESDGDFF